MLADVRETTTRADDQMALTTTTRALASIADVAIRVVLTVLPIGLLLGATRPGVDDRVEVRSRS